jgi:hypothetical protein
VHEVIFANEINIGPAFVNEFEGMTRDEVSLDVLLETGRWLMEELPKSLTAQGVCLASLVLARGCGGDEFHGFFAVIPVVIAGVTRGS